MKQYECPNCHEMTLIRKRNSVICTKCGLEKESKAFSKLDLHYKKHIDMPPFIVPDIDLVKKKTPKKVFSKQHTENMLQSALRAIPNIWYTKLQVNQLAHTRTVGDYLVLTQGKNFVFECKELNITKNKQFPFSRLSQMGDMKAFTKSMNKNMAYFVVLLWEGHQKGSPIYVIPLDVMEAHIKISVKKSMNKDDIEKEFTNYRVCFENLEAHLKKLIC